VPDTVRTRVAVLGVGGIGGFVAGMLAQVPDIDVVYCVRQSFDQLVITVDGTDLVCPGTVTTDPDSVGPVDAVLIATKAVEPSSLGPWLHQLVGQDTVVGVLQNGVEHRERFATLVQGRKIVPVVVRYGAERIGPGRVRKTLDDDLVLPPGPPADELVRLLRSAGLTVTVAEDLDAVAWRKLAYNAVSNPLTTLLGLRVHEVPRHPISAALAPLIVNECRAAARAEGVELPEDLCDVMMGELRRVPEAVTSSMSQDYRRGTPLEIDAINGAVVRTAARHGLSAPINAALASLLGAVSGSTAVSCAPCEGSAGASLPSDQAPLSWSD
jgi:2-dehydropantoate 2-reductase